MYSPNLFVLIIFMFIKLLYTNPGYFQKDGYNYIKFNDTESIISNDFYIGCFKEEHVKVTRFPLTLKSVTQKQEKHRWNKMITRFPIFIENNTLLLNYNKKQYCLGIKYMEHCLHYDQIIISRDPVNYKKSNFANFECIYSTEDKLTFVLHRDSMLV